MRKIKDAVGNTVGNDLHLIRTHTAGRHGGGADTHAAGYEGAAFFAGYGVLVCCDVNLVQVVLQLLAGALLVGQVNQQ